MHYRILWVPVSGVGLEYADMCLVQWVGMV